MNREAGCFARETDLRGDELGPGHTLTQDPDVLDTWFSSALWPHSTLGWPDETAELKKFYPTSVLSTARDIITLWVARMVIFGLFNRGDVPFRDVYIHPIIQDGKGRRMSKTAGNGVDPVDIIEIHGADALRYTLAAGATETQDLRIPVEPLKLPDGRVINTSERFEQGRNFANKFWNAARLTLMNLEGYEPAALDPQSLAIEDRWILDRLDCTIEEVTVRFRAVPVRRGGSPAPRLHLGRFLRLVSRIRQGTAPRRAIETRCPARACGGARFALPVASPDRSVRDRAGLARLERAGSRARLIAARARPRRASASHPGRSPIGLRDETARETVGLWCEVIKALRNLKAERNVPKEARIEPILVARGAVAQSLAQGEAFLKSLLPANSVTIVSEVERPADCAVAVLPEVEVILPLEGLIDHEAERAKQRKALADFERQIGSLKAKLGNESYVARAPAEVVAQTRAKLAELESQRAAVSSLLQEA